MADLRVELRTRRLAGKEAVDGGVDQVDEDAHAVVCPNCGHELPAQAD